MKNFKNLKAVPVEQISEQSIRQLDAMSRKQKYSFLFFFFVVNILFITSYIYGPPFYHIETVPFTQSKSSSKTRKFLLTIGNFNFLNDFVTIDAVFIRTYTEYGQDDLIDITQTVKSKKGKRSEILYYENSKQYEIHFPTESKVSNKIRLYSREIVDFFHLDYDLVMKFQSFLTEEEEENSIYSGAFIITYCDASHTCIESLIRLIFFICGIMWLFYFNSIEIDKSSNPLQLKMIRTNMILVVFSSNPLYILSFFTESPFLPFLDSIFSIALIIYISASTLILLDFPRISITAHSKNWMFLERLPFMIAGLFFFMNEFIRHYSKHIDSAVLTILSFMQFCMVAICISLIAVSTLLFKTETISEKIIILLMIFVTVALSLYFEVKSIDPSIPSNHSVQIFTFSTISSFVFFLAFLYKPVDIMNANDDIDDNPDFDSDIIHNYNRNHNFNDEENSYDVDDPY